MKCIVKNIGSACADIEYRILNSIKKEYETLLIHRYDTKIFELSKEDYNDLKEEYFEGYCNDTIGLRLEKRFQIKSSIVSYLQKNKLLQFNEPMGLIREDEYYKSIVDRYFNMYSCKTVDKIKEIIINIAYYSESTYKTDFIDKRIVYSNNYSLDEDGMCKVDFTNIWYRLDGEDEIKYAIREEGIYSGIIQDIKGGFDCAATSFCKFETASDYDLIIRFKENQKLSKKTKDIIKDYDIELII